MLITGSWRQIFILDVYLHVVESRIHLAGPVLNSRGHPPNRIELGVTLEAIARERDRWQQEVMINLLVSVPSEETLRMKM